MEITLTLPDTSQYALACRGPITRNGVEVLVDFYFHIPDDSKPDDWFWVEDSSIASVISIELLNRYINRFIGGEFGDWHRYSIYLVRLRTDATVPEFPGSCVHERTLDTTKIRMITV
jgi:hypothetical protein